MRLGYYVLHVFVPFGIKYFLAVISVTYNLPVSVTDYDFKLMDSSNTRFREIEKTI